MKKYLMRGTSMLASSLVFIGAAYAFGGTPTDYGRTLDETNIRVYDTNSSDVRDNYSMNDYNATPSDFCTCWTSQGLGYCEGRVQAIGYCRK